MDRHDDDFWAGQSEWQPTTNSADHDNRARPRTNSGIGGREPSGPVQIVRQGWNRLLDTGVNATREHRRIDANAPRPVETHDEYTALDAPHGSAEPTPAVAPSPARRTPRRNILQLNANMFDDLDDGDDWGPTETIPVTVANSLPPSGSQPASPDSAHSDDDEQAWGAAFARVGLLGAERPQLDPLFVRAGALIVALALLIPLFMAFNSGGESGDTLESIANEAATTETITAATAATTTEPAAAPVATATEIVELATTTPATVATIETPRLAVEPRTAETSPATVAPTTEAPQPTTTDEPAQSQQQVNDTTTPISTTVTPSTTAERIEPVCAIDYDVVPGDYWIRLATGAGVPLAELLEANGASVNTPMFPGTSICLPAGATTPPPPPVTVATTQAPTTTAAPATTTPPTTAPATTTTTTTAPPNTTPASTGDVQQIIRDVWPDELEERALEIAFRESRYVPTAKNFCCYGIFQIYWNVHKSWLDDIGITSADQLYDPATNARAAYALYQRAGGWGPWSL